LGKRDPEDSVFTEASFNGPRGMKTIFSFLKKISYMPVYARSQMPYNMEEAIYPNQLLRSVL